MATPSRTSQNQLEILLTDAREAYFFRAQSFDNLTTRTGIVLGAIGVLLGLSIDIFESTQLLGLKVAYTLFLLVSLLLSFRALFVTRLYVLKIDTMLENLKSTPRGTYSGWLEYTIDLYADANERNTATARKYNGYLLLSVSSLISAIIMLVIINSLEA